MPSLWHVDSYHLNTGVGDAAIHVLAYDNGKDKLPFAKTVIWVDGGMGTRNTLARFNYTLKDIHAQYRNLQGSTLKFDVVIVTHWDHDHYGGFTKFIDTVTDAHEYFHYTDGDNIPSSRIYWPDTESGKGPKLEKSTTGELILRYGKGESEVNLAVVRVGKSLLGTDFLSGKALTGDPTAIGDLATLCGNVKPPVDPIRPGNQPAMYCIAVDKTVIGTHGDYNETVLDVLWRDATTETNQSSIAVIIAWPSGRISHYFAGDLNWLNECRLVDWLNLDKTSDAGRIFTMKASHHGSCSSTPPKLIEAFRPVNIVVSAATKHHHPDWELLVFIDAYLDSANARRVPNPGRGPLLMTCFPYWLRPSTRKYNDNVLSLQYFGGSRGNMPQDRFNKIQGFINVMEAIDSQLYKNLRDFYRQNQTSGVTALDIYKQLHVQLEAKEMHLFSGYTQLKDFTTGENVLQWVLVRSVEDITLDASVSTKVPMRSAVEVTQDPNWVTDTFLDRIKTLGYSDRSRGRVRILRYKRYMIWYDDHEGLGQTSGLQFRTISTQQTPFFRQIRAVVPSGSQPTAVNSSDVSFNVEYPYSIWSSTNEPETHEQAKGRRLLNTDPLDIFVSDLRSGAIRLSASPTSSGILLDGKDTIFQWLQWSTKAKEVTLKGTDQEVTSLSIKAQYGQRGFAFDTANANKALKIDSKAYDIGSTGLLSGADNSVMVFGLSPDSTVSGRWSLREILQIFDGLSPPADNNVKKIPLHPIADALISTGWILDTAKLDGKRNAIWFAPYMNYNTTIRLAFDLDPTASSGPLDLLQNFWPDSVDIVPSDVQLICSYEVCMGSEGAAKNTLVSKSNVTLFATLTTTITRNKDGPKITVKLQVSIELVSTGSITLTVRSNDAQNDFHAFAEALVQEITGSKDPVLSLPEAFREEMFFRRIYLTLGQGKSLGAGLDVEVKSKLGKTPGGDLQNIAIRLSASYTKGVPGKGLALSGGLWFRIEDDVNYPRAYFSDWESFHDLEPITDKASTSLWLPGLAPAGIDVSSFPKNISQFITKAEFCLTAESLTMAGVIKSLSKYQPHEGLPVIDFKEVSIDSLVNWSDRSVSIDLEFRLGLQGPEDVDPSKETCTNELIGVFHYDSGQGDKSWGLSMSIQELKLGMLYEYFTHDAQGLLYDILKEINIRNMLIIYEYKAPDPAKFIAKGDFVIAESVSIILTYTHSRRDKEDEWSFSAVVSPATNPDKAVTLLDIARSIFGSTSPFVDDLPDFLAKADVLGPNVSGPSLCLTVKKSGPDGVKLLLRATIGSFEAVFIQLQTKDRKEAQPGGTAKPPIRYFRLSCGLPDMPKDLPLLAHFEAPFDKLGFLWVNSDLDVAELDSIEKIQSPDSPEGTTLPSTAGEKKDPGMKAGFHFLVLSKGVIVLDYPIGKARAHPRKPSGQNVISSGDASNKAAGPAASNAPRPPTQDGSVNSQSPKAPVKKSQGPLTISDIQLHYKETTLAVQMDAMFAVGPLMFALLGFEIGLDFNGKVNIQNIKVENIHVSVDGLAASFKKPPLTIEGGLVHKMEGGGDIYAGGITIAFVPWLFQAGGFYGKTKNPDTQKDFTSALLYAILRGPLITLEFATISGITGGFGYNVGINIPKVEDVYKFPFLSPPAETDIVKVLDALIKPEANTPRWFYPQDGAMWLAAGLTITAFEMLDVTAVLVVQWSPQVQFHIIGLATAIIPSAKSPVKLAHVELGFIASVDIPTGLFSVEAQLSPNSYILDPNCHLSGAFALYYWFKTTKSGKEGDWVFTIGGYHSAFQVPSNYPRPPRLSISWSLGSALAIKGEAYFAITPKACMAGLHLNAVLTLGPLRAWFNAYADFLINYAPFNFVALCYVSVGVSFNMDVWFIHVHIGLEIGAALQISGPPIAGTVHVDFWVFGFDIAFGDSSKQLGNEKLPIEEFYDLALGAGAKAGGQAASKTGKAHVYNCFGGLISNSTDTEVKEDEPWDVRGGPFAFGVNAYFAVGHATVNGVDVPFPEDNLKDDIYAKPMGRTNTLMSNLTIQINGPDGKPVPKWRLKPTMKSVPSAVWGKYDSKTDPSSNPHGNNSISDLLAADNGCLRLMMGVELTAPEAHIALDRLIPFDAELSIVENVFNEPPGKSPLWPLFPPQFLQSAAWTPAKPLPLPDLKKPDTGTGQWEVVKKTWMKADAKPATEAWNGLMKWAKPVSTVARPEYLARHVEDLFLEAPHLCIEGVA